MTTHPYRKRYTALTLLTHVKNPITLAREMLIRGEHDGTGGHNGGGDGDPAGGAGGAQGHCCLSGPGAEKLAKEWGLDMVDSKYFWTRKRWEQHRKGLGKDGDDEKYLGDNDEGGEGWDGVEYLPQGTVGCVALDKEGAICVATSTGGLTNKLAGRIGDTPTVGAGFWAEEWPYTPPPPPLSQAMPPTAGSLLSGLQRLFGGDCIPALTLPGSYQRLTTLRSERKPHTQLRAIAISGTGNGDSFLRLCACRTAGAVVRFSPPPPGGLVPIRTLASAMNQITGPGGELQQSAGDRWGKTGEGEAGMIGIEFVEGRSEVVFDFNCGGMFRCWVDAQGKERVMVFREEY